MEGEVHNRSKDKKIEFFSIPGVLYLTVDKQPLVTYRFEKHVKVEVILDDSPIQQNDQKKNISKFGVSGGIKEESVLNDELMIQASLCAHQSANSLIGKDTDGFQEFLPYNEETDMTSHSIGSPVSENEFEQSENKYDPEVTTDQNLLSLASRKRRIQNVYQSPEYSGRQKHSKAKKDNKVSRKQEKQKISKSKNVLPLKKSESTKSVEARYDHAKIKKRKPHKVKKLEMEKDVSCDFCHKWFKNQQEFFDHRKAERSFHTCKYCGKVFPFKAHLIVHLRKHKGSTESAGASHSQVSDPSLAAVDKQDVPDRKEKKGVKCDICGFVLSNIPILKTHTLIHTGENSYKCCVCGELANSTGRYNNHMSSHIKTGKIKCKICNENFETRGDLSKHKLTHDFKCNLCGHNFANKTSRSFHYKTAHPNDIIKCPQCGKLFSSDEELKSHLSYHRNRSKTQCTICGVFVSRLNNHLLSHSQKPEENQMYVCDKCPKQFKRKLSFQRHLKTHSEEKPYACMECPKRFSISGGLRKHMVTHTQEKPFVCDICGKACSQMGNLRIHMQIHKETGPISCSLCGSTFTQKVVLKEHLKQVHSMGLNSLNTSENFFTNMAASHVYHP